MSTTSTQGSGAPLYESSGATANDHFKRGFGPWFWRSLTMATVLHLLLFAFWPDIQAEDVSFEAEEIATIDIPPEVEIPPPPEQIARPATPVVSAAEIDQDITIAPTTFEENPVEMLPPPPQSASADDVLSSFRAFTPDMVEPSLRNQEEVQRALEQYYPSLLRDAGIGGSVTVLFWIDEQGKVFKWEVSGTSGYPQFDEAAGKVADLMDFSPALNRDKAVRVVVAIPIKFQVQQ